MMAHNPMTESSPKQGELSRGRFWTPQEMAGNIGLTFRPLNPHNHALVTSVYKASRQVDAIFLAKALQLLQVLVLLRYGDS